MADHGISLGTRPAAGSTGLFRGVMRFARAATFVATFCLAAAATTVSGGTAKAAASERYAAMVVDAATGRTLFSKNADAPRHPASLTKIMTAYILFEELSSGRMTMDTPLRVTAYAASQAPSKLGVRPGTTVKVRDAMLALMTRSANDCAVVIAENISGSESAFAKRMTATARRLGMRNTIYLNANGLPNPGQITTARDLAVLGLAIQRQFPTYYRYFSTRSFVYKGQTISNHNRLMSQMAGIDGIKTGYIRASGFNLVSSIKRGNKRLVAVVMGGASARARDAHMADLLNKYLPMAQPMQSDVVVATVQGTVPGDVGTAPAASQPIALASAAGNARAPKLAAEAAIAATTPQIPDVPALPALASRPEPVVAEVAAVSVPDVVLPPSMPERPASQPAVVASAEPAKQAEPAPVPVPVVGYADEGQGEGALDAIGQIAQGDADEEPAAASNSDGARIVAVRSIGNSKAVQTASVRSPDNSTDASYADDPIGAQVALAEAANAEVASTQFAGTPFAKGSLDAAAVRKLIKARQGVMVASAAQATRISSDAVAPAAEVARKAETPSEEAAQPDPTGWQIQIGAVPTAKAAKTFLADARKKGGKTLAGAEPYTEAVHKGGATLYRARFVGFSDEKSAQRACAQLKKQSYACMAFRK